MSRLFNNHIEWPAYFGCLTVIYQINKTPQKNRLGQVC